MPSAGESFDQPDRSPDAIFRADFMPYLGRVTLYFLIADCLLDGFSKFSGGKIIPVDRFRSSAQILHTPAPEKLVYPTILSFPAPKLLGYSRESTIAEKFQAMVKLGVLNSRMKDFYDIWFLSRTFDFRGETLAEAIEKTFENRNTPITVNPTVFDLSFTKDEDKKVQWLGFIKKAKITDVPGSFEDVAAAVKVFLEPIVASIVERQTFHGIWTAPGPWR